VVKVGAERLTLGEIPYNSRDIRGQVSYILCLDLSAYPLLLGQCLLNNLILVDAFVSLLPS
jgi:hypothetical protein